MANNHYLKEKYFYNNLTSLTSVTNPYLITFTTQ